MSLEMIELEVRLPNGTRTSSSFSTKKPMAEVSCCMSNGGTREIVVPVRVGRVLIKEGIGLPKPEHEAFDAIHAVEARTCFTILTEMLSRRDHSVGEVRSKLSDYGFRCEEIEPAISRAIEMRFLNDERFAMHFIEERKHRGWGKRKIEIELHRKGIDTADLPGYPDEYFDDEEDLDRAVSLLNRKRIPDSHAYEKLVRRLMTKGFSFSIASKAAHLKLSDIQDELF